MPSGADVTGRELVPTWTAESQHITAGFRAYLYLAVCSATSVFARDPGRTVWDNQPYKERENKTSGLKESSLDNKEAVKQWKSAWCIWEVWKYIYPLRWSHLK